MKSHLTATTFGLPVSADAGASFIRTFPLAILLAFGLALLPISVLAKGPPDGKTPSDETDCDGLEGAQFGICNSYCEATDCGDGVNYANFRACASLQKNWQRQTGVDEMPCDCEEGEVFLPGVGCDCGHDLVVRIVDFRPLGCPEGQGSCTYELDVEVENLGSVDILDPFDVMVALPGVGLGESANFPTGLEAGAIDQALNIPLGPGDNCFDPNCEIQAEVDPGNVIPECDETNNRDFQVLEG
jgi:hypothetical protein